VRGVVPRDVSRRTFLQGATATAGAFVLGSYVPLGERAFAAEGPMPGVFDPNVFVRIGADNSVTVISKHFEMGQGVTTGLATLVAEELGADWSQVRFEFAPNNAQLYNNLFFGPNQATGDSTSMANSWEQMRKVGAAARLMFVTAAATTWNVPAAEITVERGIVSHRRSRRRATLGELAGTVLSFRLLQPDQKIKGSTGFRVGKGRGPHSGSRCDAVPAQPIPQRQQFRGGRAERPHVLLARAGPARHAYARDHGLLVDVQSAASLDHSLHGVTSTAMDVGACRSVLLTRPARWQQGGVPGTSHVNFGPDSRYKRHRPCPDVGKRR
jgi:Molybdopterin cofactor-binding domain